MFRSLIRALLAFATVAAVGVGVSPAQAATPVSVPAAVFPVVASPRLVDVRFAEHRGFDRLVFDFRGGVPDDVRARLVRTVRREDGSRVRLPGAVFLVLRLEPARNRVLGGGVERIDLRNVRAFRLVDDEDGVVTVAIGLRRRADVRVFELSNRVVVDVANRRRVLS